MRELAVNGASISRISFFVVSTESALTTAAILALGRQQRLEIVSLFFSVACFIRTAVCLWVRLESAVANYRECTCVVREVGVVSSTLYPVDKLYRFLKLFSAATLLSAVVFALG